VTDTKIEIITTDIADLAKQGFGSIDNCRSMGETLSKRGLDVSVTVIHAWSDLASLTRHRLQLFVVGVKFVIFDCLDARKTSPDKIWIAEFLQRNNLPFTGSAYPAVELDFDKRKAKTLLQEHGLATAGFFVATPAEYAGCETLPLPFPLFVKPLYESDSLGIDEQSIIYSLTQFQTKIAQIDRDFHQPSLVESYLPGREFTVAVLADGSKDSLILSPVEIIHDPYGLSPYLSFQTKQSNHERLLLIEDTSLRKQVSELAEQAFRLLGGRDYGRIDIKENHSGKPCFLEANFLPGMHPHFSYFPAACRLVQGIDYDELAWRMILPAIGRLKMAFSGL
jgi:D-alanine-D-alanine ligase